MLCKWMDEIYMHANYVMRQWWQWLVYFSKIRVWWMIDSWVFSIIEHTLYFDS